MSFWIWLALISWTAAASASSSACAIARGLLGAIFESLHHRRGSRKFSESPD
jgi:hypothetical protein